MQDNPVTKENYENIEVSYSDYYVAFIDALGFSEQIRRSKKNDLKEVSDYFTQVKRVFAEVKKIQSKKEIITLAVSDSIILAIPARSKNDDPIATLYEFCSAVRNIQWWLSEHNIWLRGAITMGDCWIAEKQVQIAGPAYLRAVALEKAAKYPRVIIDPAIIPALKIKSRHDFIEKINQGISTETKQTFGPVFDWNRVNRIEAPFQDDTPLFIDYLGPCSLNNQNNKGVLKKIIQHIESALYEQQTYDKYRWLVNYLQIRLGSDYATGEAKTHHLKEPYEKLRSL